MGQAKQESKEDLLGSRDDALQALQRLETPGLTRSEFEQRFNEVLAFTTRVAETTRSTYPDSFAPLTAENRKTYWYILNKYYVGLAEENPLESFREYVRAGTAYTLASLCPQYREALMSEQSSHLFALPGIGGLPSDIEDTEEHENRSLPAGGNLLKYQVEPSLILSELFHFAHKDFPAENEKDIWEKRVYEARKFLEGIRQHSNPEVERNRYEISTMLCAVALPMLALYEKCFYTECLNSYKEDRDPNIPFDSLLLSEEILHFWAPLLYQQLGALSARLENAAFAVLETQKYLEYKDTLIKSLFGDAVSPDIYERLQVTPIRDFTMAFQNFIHGRLKKAGQKKDVKELKHKLRTPQASLLTIEREFRRQPEKNQVLQLLYLAARCKSARSFYDKVHKITSKGESGDTSLVTSQQLMEQLLELKKGGVVSRGQAILTTRLENFYNRRPKLDQPKQRVHPMIVQATQGHAALTQGTLNIISKQIRTRDFAGFRFCTGLLTENPNDVYSFVDSLDFILDSAELGRIIGISRFPDKKGDDKQHPYVSLNFFLVLNPGQEIEVTNSLNGEKIAVHTAFTPMEGQLIDIQTQESLDTMKTVRKYGGQDQRKNMTSEIVVTHHGAEWSPSVPNSLQETPTAIDAIVQMLNETQRTMIAAMPELIFSVHPQNCKLWSLTPAEVTRIEIEPTRSAEQARLYNLFGETEVYLPIHIADYLACLTGDLPSSLRFRHDTTSAILSGVRSLAESLIINRELPKIRNRALSDIVALAIIYTFARRFKIEPSTFSSNGNYSESLDREFTNTLFHTMIENPTGESMHRMLWKGFIHYMHNREGVNPLPQEEAARRALIYRSVETLIRKEQDTIKPTEFNVVYPSSLATILLRLYGDPATLRRIAHQEYTRGGFDEYRGISIFDLINNLSLTWLDLESIINAGISPSLHPTSHKPKLTSRSALFPETEAHQVNRFQKRLEKTVALRQK